MNGAESLVRTLVVNGVEVCFTNPGTSEMHFVSALDRVDGMRAILVLYECVATGAADGYWRMADKPASTLLHLGPGLGNGIANLHNARRANTPMVNIPGDQATYHRPLDAPLTADTEGWARGVSGWVRTATDVKTVGRDAAEFIEGTRLATALMGDSIATNLFMLGFAWQRGLVPVSAEAIAKAIELNAVAVDANKLSLEGVRAENSVGTRTILDILNAEQELLNSQVTLVTARRDAYVAGFALIAAMGNAEARDLGLDGGPLYDPVTNYKRVRNRINDWDGDGEPAPIASTTAATPAQTAAVTRPLDADVNAPVDRSPALTTGASAPSRQ